MLDPKDPEDRLIRWLLLSAASIGVLGFLATITVVAVMVATNFNILNWME